MWILSFQLCLDTFRFKKRSWNKRDSGGHSFFLCSFEQHNKHLYYASFFFSCMYLDTSALVEPSCTILIWNQKRRKQLLSFTFLLKTINNTLWTGARSFPFKLNGLPHSFFQSSDIVNLNRIEWNCGSQNVPTQEAAVVSTLNSHPAKSNTHSGLVPMDHHIPTLLQSPASNVQLLFPI